jgi:hypothetical protein
MPPVRGGGSVVCPPPHKESIMSETITESAITPLERQVISLDVTSNKDFVLAVYDRVKFYSEEIKRVKQLCEDAMIAWIKQNGDLDAGNGVRYFCGKEKTTKCNNLPGAIEAILQASDGDFTKFCDALSSNAIKYGAAKKLLSADKYGQLFTVTERDDLNEKLIKLDEKFLR